MTKELSNKLGIMKNKLPKVEAQVAGSQDLLASVHADEKQQINALKESERSVRKLRSELDAQRQGVENARKEMGRDAEKHARQVRRWHVTEEKLRRELGINQSIVSAGRQTTVWGSDQRKQRLSTLEQETAEIDAQLAARRADLARVEAEALAAKSRFEETHKVRLRFLESGTKACAASFSRTSGSRGQRLSLSLSFPLSIFLSLSLSLSHTLSLALQLADVTFAGLTIAQPNKVALAPLGGAHAAQTRFSSHRGSGPVPSLEPRVGTLSPIGGGAAAEATAMHEETMKSADDFAAFLSSAAAPTGAGEL